MVKNNRVLVVAAHPDDEVLGCGATIAKHVEEKDSVWVLILGEGITSRKQLDDKSQKKILANLKDDFQKAAKIIGVEKTILREFPDNKFDSVPLLNITHEIESAISEFEPSIIYTHSKSDVNIDHRKVLEALEPAIRLYTKNGVVGVYSFEIPSSTESNFVRQNFAPNYFVGLEKKFLDKKIKAFNCYSSEIRDFPHPRSAQYFEALAKVRGSQSGYQLAEAFEVVRIIA